MTERKSETRPLLRSMESSTYKAIFAEGRRKAREEMLAMMKRICRQSIEARLGALPPEARLIEQIDDLEAAARLNGLLIAAADPEAVRAVLRSLEK